MQKFNFPYTFVQETVLNKLINEHLCSFNMLLSKYKYANILQLKEICKGFENLVNA